MKDAPPPPPPRPPAWEERLTDRLLRLGAPRVDPQRDRAPLPAALEPAEQALVSRREADGVLDCTWFPARGAMRGAVLLAPPWTDWGQAYFHRGGRIEALRDAGYAALSFDIGGFGRSTDTRGFRDRDVADALAELQRRAPGVPHHVWGLSAGGYWAHAVLSRTDAVAGAFFEDVTHSLFDWRKRMQLPFSGTTVSLHLLVPRALRFMDIRRHAPHLRVRACAYVSGAADRGISEEDTRELARLADAPYLIVPGASHLAAMKVAPREVLALALATFARAEQSK